MSGPRLAIDNDECVSVERLDIYNFRDIPGCARKWADKMEAGEGNLVSVTVVMEWDDGISLDIWGENCSPYQTLGILEAAKLRAHEIHVGDADD